MSYNNISRGFLYPALFTFYHKKNFRCLQHYSFNKSTLILSCYHKTYYICNESEAIRLTTYKTKCVSYLFILIET